MAEPFTVPHFRAWARGLVLDNGDPWDLEDFQARFLRDHFAGYPEAWLIVPEGNAKTTFTAGLCLYHAEHKPQARVPVAASSRDQAEWLYQAAAGFCERSDRLGKLFRCQEGYRRIRCDSVGSRIQIFASDDRTGDGVIPSLCVLEELHRHRNLNLYRTWRGKLLKRRGQLVAISTAGDPIGEFEQTRENIRKTASEVKTKGAYSRLVAKGLVIHEYAVPESMSIENMRDVKKANPLKAIKVADLREKRDTPTMTVSHWRRFVCGQPSTGMDMPITAESWDRLRADIGTIQDGDQVVLAPALGHIGAVGIAALRDDGKVAIRAEVVEPREGISTQKLLEAKVAELCGRYDVLRVLDPAGGLVRSVEHMADEGAPMDQQQSAYSATRGIAATGTFEDLRTSGNLIHDGDAVLRRHALAAEMKSTEVGERYIASDLSRALFAVLHAVHAATAYSPEPKVLLPSGALG